MKTPKQKLGSIFLRVTLFIFLSALGLIQKKHPPSPQLLRNVKRLMTDQAKPNQVETREKPDELTHQGIVPDKGPTLSKNFSRFKVLNRSALPSETQREEIESLLSNAETIEEAGRVLMAESEFLDSEIQTQHRLLAIDFLGKALQWQSNPAREHAKRESIRIISRNLDEFERPRALKKTLAGDQIELYQYLLRTDPVEAIELFKIGSSTPQGALMAYTIQFESDLLGKRN